MLIVAFRNISNAPNNRCQSTVIDNNTYQPQASKVIDYYRQNNRGACLRSHSRALRRVYTKVQHRLMSNTNTIIDQYGFISITIDFDRLLQLPVETGVAHSLAHSRNIHSLFQGLCSLIYTQSTPSLNIIYRSAATCPTLCYFYDVLHAKCSTLSAASQRNHRENTDCCMLDYQLFLRSQPKLIENMGVTHSRQGN